MSPEPPNRNDRLDDPDTRAWENFQLADDDVMGEGEHDLDYNSQPESSWSSDIDDDTEQTVRDTLTEENFSARGRYRMLIPFQIETTEGIDSPENPEGIPDAGESPVKSQPSPVVLEDTTVVLPTTPRELELSDENVDKIKSIMKSFKLPDSAIPPWAKNVPEDNWRDKLVTSISSKSSTVVHENPSADYDKSE